MDINCFPRVKDETGNSTLALSPFGKNALAADTKAFKAFMKHLKKVDKKEHTVVLVQIENEAGVLGATRDFSELANDAFSKSVPTELLTYLQKNKAELYLQSVQSYIAPPITAVFLLGIFFSRINAKGSLATLYVGFIIAVIRLTTELSLDSLTPGSFLYAFGDMNFLNFSIILFAICVATAVIVSLATERPSMAQLEGLTFATVSDADKAANRASYNQWDVIASLIVLAIVIGVMYSFSG